MHFHPIEAGFGQPRSVAIVSRRGISAVSRARGMEGSACVFALQEYQLTRLIAEGDRRAAPFSCNERETRLRAKAG
jgi:hypothetical protein